MANSAIDRHALEARLIDEARRDIIPFGGLMKPDFMVGRHTMLLAAVLMLVLAGVITRLIVSMPPRHGKSLMVSQLFPCWALGHKPWLEIAQAGYADDIALEQSRRARDLFVSPAMRAVFPHVHHRPATEGQRYVAVERQAAHEWGTAMGGRYYATGVGGALTGRGADIGIIDDPLKNRQDADSPTIRQRVHDWFRSTFYTRLSPTGAIIIVMTRWHQDDLVGRLLREAAAGGEQWYVLHMPAVDDAGNALWPERWPLEQLKSIQTAVGPREWEALYQGRPSPPGGSIFQAAWWDGQNRYDASEAKWSNACVARAQSWDTAEETGEGNAYTSCTTGELTPEYKCLIRDVYRDKLEFPALVRCVIARAEAANRDNKLKNVIIENKSSGIPLIQTLMTQGPEWLKPLIVPNTPTKSKELRAQEASVWCFNGAVWLPYPAECVPWLYTYETEMFAFPASTFKDEVDSTTQLIWFWTHLLAEGCRTSVNLLTQPEPRIVAAAATA